MAENEGAVAEQEEDYQYQIRIEDAGPATKKVTVEVPRDRIDAKLAEQFKELRQQAAIPGFRPGHAPQKLIEKRFNTDVKEQVRRALISESYEQAVEKNQLQVIGEPEFDNPDAITIPDDGSLNYSFQVEVQPELNLPDLSNLKVRKPSLAVSDEHVQQALQNLQEQQGHLVPVEDRGVEEKDEITADIVIKVDGNEVAHHSDLQVQVRPARIAGIQVDDLPDQLKGTASGETRTIKAQAPEHHSNEALRGKEVEILVTVKDIKRLEPAQIDAEFLTDLGFANQEELLTALRQQMEERIQADVQQNMREQVQNYLIDNVQIELPTKLSDRQAERILNRRAINLMMRGIPRDQIEAQLDNLRGGAKEEAARDLKLFFILQKVATEQNVEVDEGELNGRIALLAIQRGRRPEKLKQEMSADGSLSNLYVQMREQKAIDKIIETAQVEEVEVKEGEQANPE